MLDNIYHEMVAPKFPVIPELRNEVSGISNNKNRFPITLLRRYRE
ncbi:hypothetical protein VCR12J2_1000013 [Vibrio coralliirubri]|nr:hypothetical protein VCR6J2_40148 [Vibrio coralliirubri]CDT76329.1 hypothetical protein VCR12J2_1000013 [Vibrio coralliirubri]CDT98197.1 hypothetical protein VCR8J2_570040 [Vibrio coralliirubri]CDU12592.1 hypothetical protein VCR17J2_360127 [Vibrio coralliirubri]